MNADLTTYGPFLVSIVGALLGYGMQREKVRRLETDVDKLSLELKQTSLGSATAKGENTAINQRVSAVEHSVDKLSTEMRDGLRQVREESKAEIESLKDLVLELSRVVNRGFEELRDRIHVVDKNKISTDSFPAITEAQAREAVEGATRRKDPRRE